MKLQLLEYLERDFDEPNDADANRNLNHELMQEIIAYLGLVRLRNEGKLSSVILEAERAHL
jgi:hypothetical protein